jgi:hypothetical protein
MKIAFITEGASEFKSLPCLYKQFEERSGNVFLGPLKVNVSPDAMPRIIARECKSRLLIAKAKGANLTVILLDREKQASCSGQIATSIEASTTPLCLGMEVRVVLKDQKFENWLVADLDALRAHPQRFNVTNVSAKKVVPNRADACDGAEFISRCAKGDCYDKVRDSQTICASMDVGRAAQHSRSFRHLLHLVGDLEYTTQCRLPANVAVQLRSVRRTNRGGR